MKPIAIIGGGLTGLSCAYHLEKAGLDYRLYEKENEVGGRLRTEFIDGFTIDRGFQVYLTAYPEGKKLLDYDALELSTFDPGAIIMHESGKLDKIYDPLRKPSQFMTSFKADVGSLKDKLKILSLRSSVLKDRFEKMFEKERGSTMEFLLDFGFGQKVIERFFKPFYGGIFLEDALITDARMFRFIYRMFSLGHAALPKNGMHEIPKQLLSHLDPSKIITGVNISKIDDNQVFIDGENAKEFGKCIIATEGNTALDLVKNSQVDGRYVSSTQFYFHASEAPYKEKLIGLNASGSKLVNNVCVLNNVVGAYAQKGNLISCTVLGDKGKEIYEKDVLKELTKWFAGAEKWELIKRMHIGYSLPNQEKVNYNGTPKEIGNVMIAGDYLQNGSINNALKMGADVAKIVESKFA